MEFAVSSEQKPAKRTKGAFRGFLCGVAFGVIFGLLANEAWGGVGPYDRQISAGFCGLVGGLVGTVIGVVHA